MTPDWSEDLTEPIPYADLTDPQTLNLYAYARNNPVSQVDPDGHDFNLACCGNSDTCQGGLQGTTTYSTDANGNTTSSFTATVITSASLADPNSGNTATVNENGVQITAGGQTAEGLFITGTAAANIQGSGQLADFSFHVDGNCGSTCLDSGAWTFNGSMNQAREVLNDRGTFSIPGENLLTGMGQGCHPFSEQYRFGGASCSFFSCPDSPHLSVPFSQQTIGDPHATVPSTGPFHVDAHADWWHHFIDVFGGGK